MAVNYIPEGAQTVTPYLAVRGIAALVEFLKATFDAKELDRAVMPDGTIVNATLSIGSSRLMMGDPRDHEAIPGMLYVYVPHVDAVYAKALAAGATSLMTPTDQFYGDRCAAVRDGSGNTWWMATHTEDLSPEEAGRRMAARSGQKAGTEGRR